MSKHPFLAAAEGCPKDSVPDNHEGIRIRKRARTTGTTARDAPGVSGADARDGARVISSAESMEKIMSQHIRALASTIKTDDSRDPLLAVVNAFEAGRDLANRIRGLEDDERDALMEAVYNPHFERLRDWMVPATSREAAVAALRIASEECEVFHAPAIAKSMLKAALGYFEANLHEETSQLETAFPVESRFSTAEAEAFADRKWENAAKEEIAERRKYDLNDLESDANHLYEMIDTIMDSLLNCEFTRNGKRDAKLDRVAALTWVARDLAETLVRHIDSDGITIGSTFSRKNAA